MSELIRSQLSSSVATSLKQIGSQLFKGQTKRHAVCLLASNRVTAEQIAEFTSKLDANSDLLEAHVEKRAA